MSSREDMFVLPFLFLPDFSLFALFSVTIFGHNALWIHIRNDLFDVAVPRIAAFALSVFDPFDYAVLRMAVFALSVFVRDVCFVSIEMPACST